MTTATVEQPARTQIATPGDETQDCHGITQIVSFRLANEEYGVDIMRVQEIILPGQITKIPEVPEYIDDGKPRALPSTSAESRSPLDLTFPPTNEIGPEL